MRVNIHINSERTYYSNDDTISASVTVLRDDAEADIKVTAVRAWLVCEGVASSADYTGLRRFRYFTSPSITPEPVNESAYAHKYAFKATFPSETSAYPSTLHYDDVNDGIQWFLRVEAETSAGTTIHGERACTFMQSGPLPSLLNLVDIEHAEIVDGAQVAVITSQAAAGLPQSPLSAGIGLCIECSEPNAFRVKRLRLLLHDTTQVSFKGHHKFLPTHRWLLSSTVLDPPIGLQSTLNLDKYTRDVQIDHASLPHSFECEEFTHSFDLAVEVTLESTATSKTRKVVSISPVQVLPRIAHTFDADELSRTTSSEIAYITDSSDEEADTASDDDDDDDDELPCTFIQGRQSATSISRSNSASSESVKSIFSDHTTKLDLDIGMQAVAFS